MAISGMDIKQVEGLAKELHKHAENVDDIIGKVKDLIEKAEWKGKDAEQFKSDWDSQGKKALKNASEILEKASKKAQKNAEEQEKTSEKGTGDF